MKTVNVALKHGRMSCDIEGFPEQAATAGETPASPDVMRPFERSCVGALFLNTSFKPITSDELKYIQDKLPELYKQLYITDEAGWLKGREGTEERQPTPPAVAETAADSPVEELPDVAAASPEPTTEAPAAVAPRRKR